MKGKVLVTGASGFIGYHLAKRLLSEKTDVHAILKNGSGLGRLAEFKGSIKIKYGDVTDFQTIEKVTTEIQPEIIFHLAATLRRDNSPESIAENMDVNFHGTLNLLNGLAGRDIERFVFVSTSEGYAKNPPFSEEHRRSPTNPYSLSKICAENVCEMFSKTYKMPITVLRPFIVYGPGQGKGMLIQDAITSMLEGRSLKTTKGEQTRDFVYIDDVIDTLILASSRKEAVGQTYNVCTGKETKIKDVLFKIAGLTGGESEEVLPYRENEVFSHFGDNSKLRSLGWEPRISLEEGLKRTVEWYKKNQETRELIL